jgi:hypothetical protein
MSEEKAKEETLDVVEENDGSATVELPEGMEVEAADGGAQSGDSGANQGDEDHPDDTDAVRAARRARRRSKKDYIRKTNEEKDQRLTLLQRQNQELMDRLSVVERKTYSSDLARLDKAIEDEEMRYQYATQKMREATDNSDGDAFTRAQEMWYDSRRKVEAMRVAKQRSSEATANQSGAANPRLIKLANGWMEQNDWYDPNGQDEDSQIAKVIDNKLMSDGWNPETKDYWDELDKRLQKRLPHHYTHGQDEAPSRRRPRSFVTGSERESVGGRTGGSTFVLDPEQVRAMKDAGYWDDPVKRAKMIKRYAQNSRNDRS